MRAGDVILSFGKLALTYFSFGCKIIMYTLENGCVNVIFQSVTGLRSAKSARSFKG